MKKPLICLCLFALVHAVAIGAENELSQLRADKEDLLRQTERMHREVQDLQQQTERMHREIEDLQRRLGEQIEFTTELEEYRLPTSTRLLQNGFEILPQNNPLLGELNRIRHIKKTASDLKSLWRELTSFVKQVKVFGDRRDVALGAMLVTAAFYDFGNPPPNDTKTGCVSNNINTGFESVDALSFELHMQSDIGCCTDFAMMLGSFLRYLGFERQVLINSAHQCIRVKINEKWHLLDAATLVFGENYFAAESRVIHYFPPYRRSRVFSYQNLFVKSLALVNEPYRPQDWAVVDVSANNRVYGAEYLNQLEEPNWDTVSNR